jgi:hypothetical protein
MRHKKGGYEPEEEMEISEESQHFDQHNALEHDEVRDILIRYRNALTDMNNNVNVNTDYLGGIIANLRDEQPILVQVIAEEGESMDLMIEALQQFQDEGIIDQELIDNINQIHNELTAFTFDGGRRSKHDKRKARDVKKRKKTRKPRSRKARKERNSRKRKSRKSRKSRK